MHQRRSVRSLLRSRIALVLCPRSVQTLSGLIQPAQHAPHDVCSWGHRLHRRLCSPQKRECPQDACACQACSDFQPGTGTRPREPPARKDAATKVSAGVTVGPFSTRSELPMYMSCHFFLALWTLSPWSSSTLQVRTLSLAFVL